MHRAGHFVALAAVAYGVFAVGVVAEAKTEWNLATVFGPTTADGVAVGHFVDLVHEKTNGEIEITVHYLGALGFKCPQHLDATENGVIELGSQCGDMVGGIPVFSINSLPFLAAVPSEIRILRDVALPYVEAEYAKRNQKVLFGYSNTPAGMWAKKAILSAEVLKNWRGRVWDQNGLKTFTNAGASVVAMPWVDVVPALSTGTIAGVVTAAEAGFRTNFNDYLDHFMAINYAAGVGELTVNLDAWDALSPKLQKAVEEASNETTTFAFDRMEQLVDQTYADMRVAGMTVVEDIPEEYLDHLRRAGAPVLQEWLDKMGPDGQAILDEFYRRVGR